MFKKLFPGRGSYVARNLDKYLGVPLIWSLGLTKKDRPLPTNPKFIAVLMSAAIGDSVLILSVVRDLKRKFPEAEITAFVGGSNKEFVEAYFEAKVIPVEIMDPLKAKAVIETAGTYDVWIDTGQWQRINSLYTHLSRAHYKIGFQTPGQARHFIFDEAIPHHSTIHELENFRNLVRPLGVTEFTPPCLPNRESKEPNRVVIHAFAGGSKPYLKEWPESYWVETINALTALGKKIFLTGVESDRPVAESILWQCRRPENITVLAGAKNLKETIQEISKAEQVISVNTGILHVAAALGVPTIGIHGPTSVKRWGPVGTQVIALQSPRRCSPCLNLGFDYGCPRNDCMKDLKPYEVLDLIS